MRSELSEYIRKEFHHLDTIYFNTAYFGPSPYSAKQTVSRALQKELNPSFHEYGTWMGVSERLRVLIADLLECSSDNITHATSSTDIINTLANGYPFAKGDLAVAINKDYPSNILPWMVAVENKKCEFKLLDLGDKLVPDCQWLETNLPAQTKIFNISHITFDTGKKIDLLSIGKFLQEKDILFVVDATQSLGGMKITQEELNVIDVLTCSTYKWMLGPYGHAFAYFSSKALARIKHQNGNWIVSPKSKVVYELLDYTTETLPGARMYDRGQASNMLAMSCLEAGLEFLKEVGLDYVMEHNQQIRDYFLENYPRDKFKLITPTDYMGNILALKVIGVDPVKLEAELKYRNIDISIRQGNLRLSFHIFNTVEQVDQLLLALNF